MTIRYDDVLGPLREAYDAGAAWRDGTVKEPWKLAERQAFAEALLSRFGGRIRRFIVEDPTLESVFLSLTGRELRDAPASARERTFQFGKRGGEHTK